MKTPARVRKAPPSPRGTVGGVADRGSRRSVRGFFVMLVGSIVGAIIGLATLDGLADRNAQRQQIERYTASVMQTFSAEQSWLLTETTDVVTRLAGLPSVRSKAESACSDLFSSIGDTFHRYETLLATDREGIPWCGNIEFPDGLALADRDYFREARTLSDTAVDSYLVGRVSGNEIMLVAHPISSDEDEFSGVVAATVPLDWIDDRMRTLELPPDGIAFLFDPEARILARSPASIAEIGDSVPDSIRDLLTVETESHGLLRAPGFDGAAHLYRVRTIALGSETVHMAVGVPSASIFAGVDRAFRNDILFTAGLGWIAMVLLIWGTNKVVTSRITTLESAASRMAEGELSVRTGIAKGSDEISSLARTFDIMAENLEHQRTALRESMKALEDREARFRLLAENMSDLVATHAPDGRFIYASPSFQSALGLDPTSLVDTNPHELIHPSDRDRVRAEFPGRALAGDSSTAIRYRIRHANGTYRWVETTTVILSDDEGNVTGLQTSTRDVHAAVRAERDRERLLEHLSRSNRELQEFAYVASHDLQEPLRKIRAFGERLNVRHSEQLDDRARDYLHRMSSAAERMQRLIEDLLEYSRVETQAKAFEPIDLNTVVGTVLDDLEPSIQEIGARFDVTRLPTVHADTAQMHRLFQNVIGNALKYHRNDVTPEVDLFATTVQIDGEPFVEITVADNGIGFEGEESERIFGMFQRLHTRDAYAGTGVGLAVCRRIVQRHGGSIWATATPGEGSRFTIRLPVKPHPQAWLERNDA